MSGVVTWHDPSVRLPLRDALLAVVLMAIALVEILGPPLDQPGARTAFAVLTISGVLFRRSRPLVCATVVSAGMTLQSVLLESPDEIGVLLTVIVATFAVGAYAVGRARWLGTAIVCVGVAAAVLTDPSDTIANLAPTLLLFVGVPLALGLAFSRTHRDIAALRMETALLADEAAAAIEEERRRIARELHDVVAHAVTLIAVQAEAGGSVIDTDREAARKSLDAIGRVSREALVELHRLLDLLGEGDADQPEGGLERLPALLEGARSAGLNVDVTESGHRRALHPGTDHCAFRILQEGLTNAVRHASGSTVQVGLRYEPSALELTVDSLGKRHTSAYGGTGRGLVGVRERVLNLGGDFSAGTTDAGGFRLRASLPLEAT